MVKDVDVCRASPSDEVTTILAVKHLLSMSAVSESGTMMLKTPLLSVTAVRSPSFLDGEIHLKRVAAQISTSTFAPATGMSE